MADASGRWISDKVTLQSRQKSLFISDVCSIAGAIVQHTTTRSDATAFGIETVLFVCVDLMFGFLFSLIPSVKNIRVVVYWVDVLFLFGLI